MRWLLVIACFLLFGASLALGRRLGRTRSGGGVLGEDEASANSAAEAALSAGPEAEGEGKRELEAPAPAEGDKLRATIVISVCLVAILARVALSPSLEYQLFGADPYAMIRPWWPIPFALALLGAGSHHMSTENAGRGLLVFAGLLWIASAVPLIRTATFDPRAVTGVVDRDGVCQQTTDFTCGAAAAATLLAHYGVEVSERDMAVACWTNAATGTDVFCAARGLQQKLEGTGREVRVRSATYEDLVASPEPLMCTIRYGLMVDHWVVVRKAHPDRVEVGDPLKGVVTLTKDEFLRVWRRGTLSAERSEGG